MACFNTRTLSFTVAGLIIAFCIITALIDLTLMGMFFWDSDFQNSPDHDAVKDFAVQYFIIVFITSVSGLVTAILFIMGVKKECPSQMAPFVYLTGSLIIFMAISILCMYIADLIKEPTYAHAVVEFIGNCLSLVILIFFTSPIFLVYKKMSASVIQPEQLALSADHKSTFNYGDEE